MDHKAILLTTLDWGIIVAYFLLSLLIGLWYTKRASTGLDEFFLGGRNLTWWVAGVSMVATTFAADTPLAVTELVARNGVAGNWLWWNMLLGGMLTTFFFAKLWRRANILTDIEFIELRYSGKEAAFLRGFRSVYLGLFMNALIIGWVNVALKTILVVFFNMSDGEALVYTALAMLITVIYSSLSGLMGVAITDFVQFIIAMAGCIVLAILVVGSEKIGGIEGLKSKLPSWSLEFFPTIGNVTAGNTATTLTLSIGSFLAFTCIQWWASWYPGAEPGGGGYIAQRMMSTKNERHAFISTLFFQIAHYAFRPWPWILVGLCTIVLYPELGMNEKGKGYVYAMQEFLPNGFRGLLLVAFFAAYMSTIATQLNWGTSYLVKDFYNRFISDERDFVNKAAAEKNFVFMSRLLTFLVMLVSLIATSFITTISGVWEFIMQCGAGLGLVLILRWYWWRINAWSEIVATVVPFAVFGLIKLIEYTKLSPLLHQYGGTIPDEALKSFQEQNPALLFPGSFFITVGVTTVSWIAVTLVTAPVETQKLQNFYKLIRPQGAWGPVRQSLGITQSESNLGLLTVCWLSSVVMCYSILFLFGKLIFREWTDAMIYFGTGLASALMLIFATRKVKIFED